MKTAVDSNVILDLLSGDSASASLAQRALDAASDAGVVVICPVVCAEIAAHFAGEVELEQFLDDVGLQVEDFSRAALQQAGTAWRAYTRRRGQEVQCSRCGRTTRIECPECGAPLAWRQHLVSDFLIGGHAEAQADALMTRDRGYYRTYFPQLQLVVPGGSPTA